MSRRPAGPAFERMPRFRCAAAVLACAFVLGACSNPVTGAPSPGRTSPSTPNPGPSAAVSAPPLIGHLALWHPYAAGSPELDGLDRALGWLRARNPGLTIEATAIGASSIHARFEHDSGLGSGPDLLLAPDDALGDEARAGYLVDLTGLADDSLAAARPVAQAAATVGDRTYQVPWTLQTVALYHDAGAVAAPPTTTDALLAFAQAGGRLGVAAGPELGWGWYGAFGGSILDPADRCVASENSGVSDAIAYVASLARASATVVSGDASVIDHGLADGTFDVAVSDDVPLAPSIAARPRLAVIALPAGPAGPAAPIVRSVGWSVNAAATTTQQALAIAATEQLAGAPAEQLMADAAGVVPANASVAPSSPLVAALATIVDEGEARPQSVAYDRYLAAFRPVWSTAIAGGGSAGSDPAALVTAACSTMNGGGSPQP